MIEYKGYTLYYDGSDSIWQGFTVLRSHPMLIHPIIKTTFEDLEMQFKQDVDSLGVVDSVFRKHVDSL